MDNDLDRPALRADALAQALHPEGWRVEVLAATGSTNAVVVARAQEGEAAGLVVVAEEQTAGRGRLDRSWVSPSRAGLTFSVLLRPELPPGRWPLVPLWGGVAVARALREEHGLEAVLKWPNDVLVGGRKICGLLAEASDQAVVLGVGLNVTTREDELPHDQATSLTIEGAASIDRESLLGSILRALAAQLEDGELTTYRAMCASLGRNVRLELPGGESAEGVAEAVDDAGRLVVAGVAHAAGDVIHLR